MATDSEVPALVVFALPAPPAPEPAPLAPFDISDEVEVARYARKRFRVGHSLSVIAAALARFRIPAPNGGQWHGYHVQRLLLRYPRESPFQASRMAG